MKPAGGCSSRPPPRSGTRGPARSATGARGARGCERGDGGERRTAQDQGTLRRRDADAARLVFELNALLHEANGHFLLFRDPVALEHARAAIADRLGTVRAPAR